MLQLAPNLKGKILGLLVIYNVMSGTFEWLFLSSGD
jgi:hypothetical protein